VRGGRFETVERNAVTPPVTISSIRRVNTRKYVYIMTRWGLRMTTKPKRHKKRRGEPFMVYFTREQSSQLKSIGRDRHVSRAVLVRFAVDQLFKQLGSGQLELPLGLGL
jgi:hypothetical protein